MVDIYGGIWFPSLLSHPIDVFEVSLCPTVLKIITLIYRFGFEYVVSFCYLQDTLINCLCKICNCKIPIGIPLLFVNGVWFTNPMSIVLLASGLYVACAVVLYCWNLQINVFFFWLLLFVQNFGLSFLLFVRSHLYVLSVLDLLVKNSSRSLSWLILDMCMIFFLRQVNI